MRNCFVGISLLLSNEQLRGKIGHYQEHGIEPVPGGQFLEYAEIEGVMDRYLPAVVEAGYRWVEVSDNLAPVGLDWKEKTIRLAAEEFGLNVFGEVGKKEGLESDAPLADNAVACLAGAVRHTDQLGLVSLAGVVIMAGLLGWEQSIVRGGDMGRIDKAFFQINSWIGMVLLAVVLVDLYLV